MALVATAWAEGKKSYVDFVSTLVGTESNFELSTGNTYPAVAMPWGMNFCFMNELEAWNVNRRTGFPNVKFQRDTQVSEYPTPPNRLPYPGDELNFNKDNCQAAIATNYKETTGYYTNLFWAKEVYYSLY